MRLGEPLDDRSVECATEIARRPPIEFEDGSDQQVVEDMRRDGRVRDVHVDVARSDVDTANGKRGAAVEPPPQFASLHAPQKLQQRVFPRNRGETRRPFCITICSSDAAKCSQ